MVGAVHRGERRDVEDFVTTLANYRFPRCYNGNDVGVTFVECVADLVEDRYRHPIATIAKINRQRIKGVAENSRIAKHTNGAAVRLKTSLNKF